MLSTLLMVVLWRAVKTPQLLSSDRAVKICSQTIGSTPMLLATAFEQLTLGGASSNPNEKSYEINNTT